MAKKKNKGSEKAIVAGVTAAVAGLVFLYGSEAGAKKRKKIKGWTLKAKGEVLEKLEKAKEVNEDVYNSTVDKVMAKYAKLKHVNDDEVEPMIKEFKKHWNQIKKELKTKPKTKSKAKKKPTTKKK
jgi:hypothetical protein